jgi:hypothetical protein
LVLVLLRGSAFDHNLITHGGQHFYEGINPHAVSGQAVADCGLCFIPRGFCELSLVPPKRFHGFFHNVFLVHESTSLYFNNTISYFGVIVKPQNCLFIFCGFFGSVYQKASFVRESPLAPYPALIAAPISPAPVTHSRRPNQTEKAQKQPPRNSTGAAFIYLISIFQSGFALATGELTIQYTRFHRLYISILANSFISAARSSGLFAHLLTHSGKW